MLRRSTERIVVHSIASMEAGIGGKENVDGGSWDMSSSIMDVDSDTSGMEIAPWH